MEKKSVKKPVILGVLFLLPVAFLLFLYPSTHNYNSLDIVKNRVQDIGFLLDEEKRDIDFIDNITIALFLGEDPMKHTIPALNLKELIYDKFKGFKRFQIIAFVESKGVDQIEEVKKQLYSYEPLEYWHFVVADGEELQKIFEGLRSDEQLRSDYSFDEVFIIDKELQQRGRIDDRNKNELKNDAEIYGLYSYNCIEVAELKNKMSEDMRILFTEYRQKRKGNYNSTARRAEDLKTDEKN